MTLLKEKPVAKKAKKETAKAVIKKDTVWPKVVKGNHLTVTTHENGQTELEWDDEALLLEVREAILAYEQSNLKPAVKAKGLTRAKKVKSTT
jgi:YD repeat-containing protein